MFVKIALLAVASAIVAVAQLAQVPANGSLTTWQIAGIFSSIIVAVGAVFIALTEDDASEELAIASKAIEEARALEDSYEGLEVIFGSLDRTIELFRGTMAMRGAIEALIATGVIDEAAAADSVVKASGRSLAIAMDFAQSDQWTICVYQAIAQPNGRVKLRCAAHKRAIECDIANAREWDEGVGVAGVSFANVGEIIIPDMLADGFQTVFISPMAETREYDDDRYRSIVSVPIAVDGIERPWGVVVCSSDQPGHFSPDGTTGTKTHEGARALAGMIALAIAGCRRPPVPANAIRI